MSTLSRAPLAALLLSSVALAWLPACGDDAVSCDGVVCGDHGACAVEGGAAVCVCASGWAGDVCGACADGYVADGAACISAGVLQCGDASAFDWRDSVMYFAMVDRFFDSDGVAVPVEGVTEFDGFGSSGQYEGGDLAGVTAKMGYLADLGVTAIWLTAPFENRNTRGRGTNDPRWYSAYHGYWPSPADIDYTDPENPAPRPKVEDRIGTEADLTALVAAAHAADAVGGHGVKVLFDYVMNHVEDESGLFLAHPDWFTTDDNGDIKLCAPQNLWNDPYWGTRCAFAKYLPAFDFTLDAPRAWSVADAVWWAKTFGIDGYRIDAVKHVPLTWLTDLRAGLDDAVGAPAGDRFYLVGETFDYNDREFLKSFIDPDTMLDGQFDFPFKLRLCQGVFGDKGLTTLSTWMDTNDAFYDVEGASKRSLMTTWIGNHDVPRAIHFASGQITDCGMGSNTGNAWTDDYPQPTETEPYERLGVAFAIMMTSPGIPLLYYGDEIGLAGGGDPDNRRMMVWDDAELSAAQLALRDQVRALARARGEHKALSRGVRTTLEVTADTWLYRMGGCGEVAGDVLVAVNRGDAEASVTLPEGSYTDALAGGAVTAGALALPPRSFRLLTVE